MILNPFRWLRRRRRLRREACEEAEYLRKRYGADALAAARLKLKRKDLTAWGRTVVEASIRVLQTR